ncbi:MAG TPA: DUF1848 family protein [Spirochaetota bacterium]|nr:DUF1848 family protein [Spirochaetota bacterium]
MKSPPLIISASRRTDIPALYPAWFENRVRAGFADVPNPRSLAIQRVSFAHARVFVLWSKNPAPLVPRLDALSAAGCRQIILHYTINNQPDWLEPGLPDFAVRIETFRSWSRIIGPERINWRSDPLVLADGLDCDRLVERVTRVGEALAGCTKRMIVSFVGISQYPRVAARIAGCVVPGGRTGGGLRSPTMTEREDILGRLAERARSWGMALSSCADRTDWRQLGVGHSACVDARQLRSAFPEDGVLQDWLGREDGQGLLSFADGDAQDLVQGLPSLAALQAHPRRDRGQREACACLESRDIGVYGTCTHGCLYCYADVGERLTRQHDPAGTSLLPPD